MLPNVKPFNMDFYDSTLHIYDKKIEKLMTEIL